MERGGHLCLMEGAVGARRAVLARRWAGETR